MRNKITVRQAFDTMTLFLDAYWEKTGSDEIANLLSDMNTNLWADGSTADPAIWGEWIDSINKITHTQEDSLTVLQAFQSMGKFLEQYIPFNTPTEAVNVLKNGIQMYADGSIANPVFWDNWIQCVNTILKQQNIQHIQ